MELALELYFCSFSPKNWEPNTNRCSYVANVCSRRRGAMIGRHRPAYHEITKGACQLKDWCGGRSYAASVHSDIPNNPRRGRRRSKDERKAMFKCFVNGYRKLNAGKFPKPSYIQKHVGCSYYSAKWNLQEMQHKAINSSLDDTNEYAISGEQFKENSPLCEVKGITSSPLIDNEDTQNDSQTIEVKHVEIGDTNAEHLDRKTSAQTSACIEKTSSKEFIRPLISDNESDFVATRDQVKVLGGEVTYPSTENREHDSTKKDASKVALSLDGPQHKGEQSQVPLESNKYAGETSVKQAQTEEHPKMSSFWGNLKSMADGIINMWRKR